MEFLNLSQKNKVLFGYLGIFIMVFGVIMLIPLVFLVFYPEEYIYAKHFILPSVISLFTGYLLYYFLYSKTVQITIGKNAFWMILLIWILSIFILSMPFVLYKDFRLVHALFEATSGLTTTGLSVFDVTNGPHLYLFYRSLLLFVGGVGLILLFVSVLSHKSSYQIYKQEGHEDKLSSNLVKSARLILTIYSFYIILGTLLLWIAGMPLFDAFNHSIAALSTGGFSTRANSIAYYDNVWIDLVIIFLMMLGGTNFLVHYNILTGNIKRIRKHVELYFMAIVIVFIVPIITIVLTLDQSSSFWSNFRIVIFQIISASTTTGFQNVESLVEFSSFFILIMVLFMLIGGGIGSTAGGMKQFRFILILKSIYWYLVESVSSNRMVFQKTIVKTDKKETVSDKMIQNTFAFAYLYIFVFILGTLGFVLYGYSIGDSAFEFASSMGTVGFSVGIISFHAKTGILWISMLGMFVGRLELIIVFIVLVGFLKKIIQRG